MAIPDMNYATREELLETAKMLVKSIELRFGTTIPVLTKSLDASISNKIGDIVSRYDKQIEVVEGLHDIYNKRLSGLEMDLGVSLGKTLEGKVDRALEQELDKRISVVLKNQIICVQDEYCKQMFKMEEAHTKRIQELEIKHQEEVCLLKMVLEKGLVQINELLRAISIPAPMVQVNVPEQQVPVVNVTVPVRKVKKQIQYNQHGQPVEIIETEGE